MITRTRRRLLMAARALRANGTLPPGVEDGSIYHGARSGYFVTEDQGEWRQVYDRRLAAALRPTGTSAHAAE
jgi:hypothetical protein